MRRKPMLLFLLFMLFQLMAATAFAAEAEMKESVSVSLRVEGPDAPILQETFVSGATALEVLKKALEENDIPYVVENTSMGPYVKSIHHVEAGSFGGYDGWNFAVKRDGEWISPDVGLADFQLEESDQVLVYYTDYVSTALVESIEVSPDQPKAKESFKVAVKQVRFEFPPPDYKLVKKIDPAAGVTVTIGEDSAVTDEKGIAAFDKGLPHGQYEIVVTGYRENGIATVVRAVQELKIGANFTYFSLAQLLEDERAYTQFVNLLIEKNFDEIFIMDTNPTAIANDDFTAYSLEEIIEAPELLEMLIAEKNFADIYFIDTNPDEL